LTPLSRIPVAQKATSYDEGRINAQEGREQRQVCGQICYSARQSNDFTIVVESQFDVKHSDAADSTGYSFSSDVTSTNTPNGPTVQRYGTFSCAMYCD
jgi:hypothetical protein